ncbi:hypothetical protein DK871_07610 [Pseudomonas sp. L13]|nr:hypothetical protein [Pseudomonas sp. L13]
MQNRQRPQKLTVGASWLAKNSQAPRSSRISALSLTFFASKLAPTGKNQRAVIFQARWILALRAKSGSMVLSLISSTA